VKKLIISTLVVMAILTGGLFMENTNDVFAKGMYENSNRIAVRASHILVDTKEEALQLKNDIESGKISFETAAQKYSKCPSGQRGGDLGAFGRGQMVKPFEDAAFSAPVGEVTEPVQTQFGYHLIKVTAAK